MIDIEKVNDLEVKATRGPWSPFGRLVFGPDVDAKKDRLITFDGGYASSDGQKQEDDARFVAEVRNAIPALIAELRIARKVIEAAKKEYEDEAGDGVSKELAEALDAYERIVGSPAK